MGLSLSSDNTPDIRYLFEPRGVAVIGASASPDKIGFKVVDNIVSGGYKGKVYPVNPKGGEVLGLSMAKSLKEIAGPIDMACLTIPAKFVLDAVQECAVSGVKFLSIITSGFSEIGNTEEEKAIVSCALTHGMRVMGPNIFGIYSANASLNATFGPKNILNGNVAIITQSGALGIGMIGKTAVAHIGLSAMVSVGNKADITESDLLDYLMDDKQTQVIMLYTEGIRDGERLIETLSRVTRKKPVVMIKSGRSKRGALAAASHTGALAGSDEILNDIVKQCGVIRAESVQDAFNWCKFFTTSAMPRGENTVIITNGGGIGVIATDACEKYKVSLYDDSEVMKKIFANAVPEFGSLKNPIDLTGQARSDDYNSAMASALANENIHSVISLYCETAVFDVDNLAKMIRENTKLYQKGGKPILFSIFGGEATENCILSLRQDNAPVFPDVYEAVSCLGALMSQYRHLQTPPGAPVEAAVPVEAVNAILDKASGEGRYFLLAHEAKQVMELCGINMPKSAVARSIEEAVSEAENIGYPVVMKIVSKDILHKSDAGGVALDLENREEVVDAFEAIMHNCRNYNPRAVIEGVEVAEMVKKGMETIVGARRDASFGPIVMCGMGGVYVEVLKDVAFRAVPFSQQDILSMIKETRIYPLLLGVRGEEKKDMDGVIETIIKLASLVKNCERISDIEVNPLVVYEQGKGVKAVDARVLIKGSEKH
jgi:acetate---CoA ligase (ADP-forming)